MHTDITGAILAGGKSSRMGVNKSFLELDGRKMIDRTVDLMKDVFERVILITNDPLIYGYLGLDMFEDIYPGYGPIVGIHTALVNSLTAKCFVLSCDMPFIDKDAIEFIARYDLQSDIVVPRADGFVQQLCGIYSVNLITGIEDNMLTVTDNEERDSDQKKRKCRVHRLIDRSNSKIIDAENEYYAYRKDLFFNMNSMADYNYVKSVLSR